MISYCSNALRHITDIQCSGAACSGLKFSGCYTYYKPVNPCLIIQISNKAKADEELENEILPALNNNPELKWMLIVNDSKECDTND